jgi:hypothetical protein
MGRIHNWKDFNNSSNKLNLVKESQESAEASAELSKRAGLKMTAGRIMLLKDSPFFGDLAIKLNLKEDKNLRFKTMATDGFNLYYDPGFVMKMDIQEIKWIICHEIMHCVLNHFLRKQADPSTWNAACDYALNQRIDPSRQGNTNAYGKMPDLALGSPKDSTPEKDLFIGKSAEWIYQYMIENNVQLPPEEGWNYGGVEPPRTIGNVKMSGGSGGSGGSKPPKPKGRLARVGDYVALPNGGWGKVEAIDPGSGDCDIKTMTESEVKAEIESEKGRKIKSIK